MSSTENPGKPPENGAVAAAVDLTAANETEDLDSIMQELESLDQEREADASKAAAPSENTAKEEAPVEVASENPVPLRTNRAKNAPRANANGQSLTLELTGTLNLKLSFVTGARAVELICTDEALVCRFGDGTEVRIPTDNPRAASLRRAG